MPAAAVEAGAAAANALQIQPPLQRSWRWAVAKGDAPPLHMPPTFFPGVANVHLASNVATACEAQAARHRQGGDGLQHTLRGSVGRLAVQHCTAPSALICAGAHIRTHPGSLQGDAGSRFGAIAATIATAASSGECRGGIGASYSTAAVLTALPLATVSDAAVDSCVAPRVVVLFTCTAKLDGLVSPLSLQGCALGFSHCLRVLKPPYAMQSTLHPIAHTAVVPRSQSEKTRWLPLRRRRPPGWTAWSQPGCFWMPALGWL